MIVKKTWERFAKDRKAPGGYDNAYLYRDTYIGWFLFGLIPLYVVRERVRR
jgi:hypothetical protein